MLQHVVPNRFYVIEDLRQLRKAGAKLVDFLVDGEACRLLAEGVHCIAALFFELRDGSQAFLHLALDLGDRLLRRLFPRLRPFAEGLGVDHLALVHGGDREAHGRADDGHSSRGCLLSQRLEDLLRIGPQRLVDGGSPALIVVALEQRRQGDAKVLDHLSHGLLQLHSTAGGQSDGDRPVQSREVVDVDPILQRLAGRLHGLEHLVKR